MKFIIKHEIKGRIRISLARKFHTVREADVLEQYLLGLDGVTAAKVYERTADAVIYYKEDREAVLVQVAAFDGQITEKQEKVSPVYPGFQLVQEETLEFDFRLTEHQEIMQLLTMTPHLWRIGKEGAQRAEKAETLQDRAQVLLRLYQSVATSSGL